MGLKLLIAKLVCSFGSAFTTALEKESYAHSDGLNPVTQKAASRQFFTQEAKIQQKSLIGETLYTKDGKDHVLSPLESAGISREIEQELQSQPSVGRYKPHPVKTPWMQPELIKSKSAPILDAGKAICDALNEIRSVKNSSIVPQGVKEPHEDDIRKINIAVRQQLADLGINLNKTENS